MQTHQTLLILAAVFGCVALLLNVLTIPMFCSVTMDGKSYKCSGVWYDRLDISFNRENIKVGVKFIFNILAILSGVTTIILTIIALCKEMVKNFIYMIVTIVLAAVTSFCLLVASALKTALHVRWNTDKDLQFKRENDIEGRGEFAASQLQLSFFLVCFRLCHNLLDLLGYCPEQALIE